MSAERDAAELAIRRKILRAMKVYEQGMRTEMYDVLERNQVGRGIKWPGNRNPSSRPFDPPARQSGRLMESIAVIRKAKIDDLTSEIGPRPQAFVGRFNYPTYLEGFGSEFGSRRVAPRPFMRPAIKNFVQRFKNARVV